MIRLNLGCADLKKGGWTNVDLRASTKPDLVADALDLSAHFEPNSVDEIYAGHICEHLKPREASAALRHWYSLLKPGGILTIVTPDFRYLAGAYLQGGIPIEEMTDLYVFSWCQESEHKMLWDQELQFKEMLGAGFKNVKAIDRMSDPILPYKVDWQVGTRGEK